MACLDCPKNSRNDEAIFGGCKIGPHKSDIYGINKINKSILHKFIVSDNKNDFNIFIKTYYNKIFVNILAYYIYQNV